jgi:hypothetical protein
MVIYPVAANRPNLIQGHAGRLAASASIDLLLVNRYANRDLRPQDLGRLIPICWNWPEDR